MNNEQFEVESKYINQSCRNMRGTLSRSATAIAESILSDPVNAKIIRYRFVSNLNSSEIASLVGMKPSAVRQRISRLKKTVPSLDE